MKMWRTVLRNPKPAEAAFVLVLFIVTPAYLMVRVHAVNGPDAVAGRAGEPDRHRYLSLTKPGTKALLPFRTDDIDPQGLLQVQVPAIVSVSSLPKRDLSRFLRSRREAPRPAARPAQSPAAAPLHITQEPPVAKEPEKPEVVARPIEGFEYIGVIETGDSWIAALKKNDRIFVAEAGDVIKAKRGGGEDDSEAGKKDEKGEAKGEDKGKEAMVRYVIHKVRPKKVIMGYPGNDYRQSIEFQKNDGPPNQKERRRRSRSSRSRRSRRR